MERDGQKPKTEEAAEKVLIIRTLLNNNEILAFFLYNNSIMGKRRLPMLEHQMTMNFSIYTDLYEKLIPKGHLLRRLNEMIDFSFIEAELETKYSPNMGRKAISPIQMFKYLL